MNRKLIFLNLLLIAGVALAGRQYRQHWLDARAREHAVLNRKAQAAPVMPAPRAEAAQPLQASSYLPVAQNLIFSKDRNPVVVIEAQPEKPVPPFPVAHGMMDLGAGPTVILSEKAGGQQKTYRGGDKVGPFLLASVTKQDLLFEWEGKKFTKTIAELKVKEKAPEAAPAAGPASPAVSTIGGKPGVVPHETTTPEALVQAQKSIGPGDNSGPGIDIGGSVRACSPGDTSPAGAVMGGYRKVINDTPFGKSCRWEPAR